MEFYNILLEIMREKDMDIPTVARTCKLSDSTVRSIIDRKQKKIALNVAYKLSIGLDVSLERLNGMPETQKEPITNNDDGLTDLEKDLVRRLTSLSAKDVQRVFDYAQGLLDAREE